MTGGSDEEKSFPKQRSHATTATETDIQELDLTVTADVALVQQVNIRRSPLSFETEGDKNVMREPACESFSNAKPSSPHQ